MKKYFLFSLFVNICLLSQAQSINDTLQLFLKKKDFSGGLEYCQRNKLEEKPINSSFLYMGEIYLRNNKICEGYKLLETAKNDGSLSKKEIKKCDKEMKKHKATYDSAFQYFQAAANASVIFNYPEAKGLVLRGLAADPHCSPALELLLSLAVSSENEQEIDKYFQLAKKENPFNEKIYKDVGEYYHKKGEFAKAIITYEGLKKTNEAEALYAIATVYYTAGNYEKSISYYKQSYNIKKDLGALFNIGLCYAAMKKYDLALSQFEYLKKVNYKNNRINELIGKIYFSQEKYEEALKYYKEAIKNQPENGELYFYAGRSRGEMPDAYSIERSKNMEESEFFYRKALALNPNDTRIHYYLGFCLNSDKDYMEGISIIEKALLIDSADYDLWYVLDLLTGYSNRDKGGILAKKNSKRGINCYKNLLKQNPNDAVLHHSLGRCYMDYGSQFSDKIWETYHDSCVYELKNAIDLDSSQSYFFEWYTCYLKMSWKEKKRSPLIIKECDSAFEKWYRLFPNEPDAMEYMFYKLFNEKKYEEANEIYVRMNTLIPQYIIVHKINTKVRANKKVFKWSDICETQECEYF